jgi:hypothetical protein
VSILCMENESRESGSLELYIFIFLIGKSKDKS